MIVLLMLGCLTTSAYAVSHPEIATKSGKSPSSSGQQQVSHKALTQHDEPLLNSINAYAQQYESATSSKPYGITQLYSQPYPPPTTNFRFSSSPQLPSSPTIEHNFQPMPTTHNPHNIHHHHQQSQSQSQLQQQSQQQPQAQIQADQNPPTPVIMQYLPQSQMNAGVQYLQLIPTRPLLVPISPYMSSSMAQPYQSPQIVSPQYNYNDYSGRSLIPAVEPDQANAIPYGIPSYANSMQNYRSYRINRETKPQDNILTADMFLNMNEYMPSPSDAPKPVNMIRGRP